MVRGGDTFRVSVVDPAGNVVGPVNVGTATNFTLPGGNTVRIDHRNSDPFNGDRRVFMTFAPGAMGTMRAGNWTIRILSVTSPAGGRFDAWIQRGNVVPGFLAPHETAARTISTPGTAREVITAGNYITRGAGVGSLASSSSRGPTRDGRVAPTLAAPGMMIMSADGERSSGDNYRLDGGTSMASPHVVGVIALMFQKNGSRTQAEIKACLESSARSDAQTGPVPNTAWGAGKLDANAAVNCVPSPGLTVSVVVTCQRSVLTPCISVPAGSCRPSVITTCVSVPVTSCRSVLNPCISVPVATCGTTSRLQCPSVVDACPSTPGGCVQSVACGPGGVLTPGGGVVTPGGVAGPGRPSETLGMALAPLPEGWTQPSEAATQQPQVPEKGYFDYDEHWFDDDPK